jgi:hypothetical protein
MSNEYVGTTTTTTTTEAEAIMLPNPVIMRNRSPPSPYYINDF